MDNLLERAQDKALTQILSIDRDIKKLYQELESGAIAGVTPEQLESVIEFKKREQDVWKLILNRVQ